jgi:hypothetical protein
MKLTPNGLAVSERSRWIAAAAHWRRAHLRLQNAKSAGIADGSHEYGAG